MEPRRLDRARASGFDHLIKKQPTGLVGTYVDEPTVVYENGVPSLGYFFVPPSLLRDIRRVVKQTKPTKNGRTWGIPTQSTVYGVMPRNALRVDYCRYTASSRSELEFFKTMDHYCEVLCELYQRYFPDNYAAALAEVQGEVAPDWRHNSTPFQTININVNHAIRYHRDTGNFRKAMSTVLIVKEEIEGGELVCPEFDLTLSQRDGAFTLFDGQGLVHGVLPIRRTKPNGYRASVVFYSMNGLRHCYPYQEEINRLAEKEKQKGATRYSLENKKNLVRQCRRALERANSPWLRLLDEDESGKEYHLHGREEEGEAARGVHGAARNVGREGDSGGLEEE